MSASMEEVLRAHRYNPEAAVCECSDEVQIGLRCDPQTREQHISDMLREAGFGSKHDAWHDGAYHMWIANGGPDGWLHDNPYPTTEGES